MCSLLIAATHEKAPWWTSCRLCLAIIGFLGFVHIYAQRVGMSVAIVCMVNQTATHMLRTQNMANSVNISNQNSAIIFSNSTHKENDGPTCLMQQLRGEEQFSVSHSMLKDSHVIN